MTTYVEARDTLISYIHTSWTTAYPTVPIYYEDTVQIALDNIPDGEFVLVSLAFTDNVRQGIDFAPLSRTYGEVVLRVFSKEGKGTRRTLSLFDYLTALMKYRTLTGVTLESPVPGKVQSRDGWTSRDLVTDFFFFQ